MEKREKRSRRSKNQGKRRIRHASFNLLGKGGKAEKMNE
jgi:hypothetical protein